MELTLYWRSSELVAELDAKPPPLEDSRAPSLWSADDDADWRALNLLLAAAAFALNSDTGIAPFLLLSATIHAVGSC